jgi:hypothetical protein
MQQAKEAAAKKAEAAAKAKEAINDPTAAATLASSNTAAKDEAIRHPTTPAAGVMESSVPVDSPNIPNSLRVKTDKNEWNEAINDQLGGSNTPTIPPNVYADKAADTNKTDETIYTQGDDGTIIPDKDLPVPANGFKNKGLNQFYTSDGGKVVPDAAGYFVPENEEQWDALTRYAEKHDLVEVPSGSSSVRGKKDQEAYKSKK